MGTLPPIARFDQTCGLTGKKQRVDEKQLQRASTKRKEGQSAKINLLSKQSLGLICFKQA
jgi:hypothetical protein